MVDVRVSAASGTSDDWAASTLVLGVGQFAWETDTQILRIGDGQALEPNLPIVAQGQDLGSQLAIDDGNPSSGAVWSSLKTQAQDTATLTAAKQYTDQAVQASPSATALVYAVVQNTTGTWASRPAVGAQQVVFWFQIVANTPPPAGFMLGNDQLIVRS